jgi:alpha-glucosidase
MKTLSAYFRLLFFLLLVFTGAFNLAAQHDQAVSSVIKNRNSGSPETFQMTGKYLRHTQSEHCIDFQCDNALVRLDICTEDMLRIRMSPSGIFKPNETWVVIRYDWPDTQYTLEDKGKWIAIRTGRLLIKAFKSPFRFEFCDSAGRIINKDWKAGSMGFRGNEIICKKELSGTDHFFGLGQRYEKSDLRGMKNVCLVTREYTPIPFFLGTDGYGIFFHNTWTSTFDFTQNPYSFSAPGGGELDYYFIYGPDFKHIIHQYSKITGLSPLPPKWAFGLFFSRWDEEVGGINYRQEGQKGMLRTIQACREVWDWPLDGIRVHSMGPKQSFYASPNLNWPDMLWGTFPAVDTFVMKLHLQHIHPLFWEAPGVTGNCKMYDEAAKNNYLLIKDGKPLDIEFGYLQPPGGLVDFMNPEARKWWGKYHHYMADFGSDGVAGDWADEKMIRNTVSPYKGMSSDEFLNVYSLLFNQASWDAYKERKPDKRCVNFGLVYWAGGQRYPMQGTQDSHAAGKNIFGEMMGCINLGLSGIPFRTFTDNVSREMLPGLPYSRLSQYLSLTVAGERTLCTLTGNAIADWNYRFYAKLRYRLMPYIYTFAREATQTGVPLVRALILENQNDTKTYDAYCEYLLGKDILIAPLWSDTTFYRDIYLPEGEWIDYFDEITYHGKQTITYHAPIDRVPILIKAGAIIPMAPDNQRYVDEIKSPLTIQIYPKGEASFELYEDDAESYDYEKGVFAITRFSYIDDTGEMIIKKSAPAGLYKIQERDLIFCVHQKMQVKSVLQGGRSLRILKSNEELNTAGEGWIYDQTAGRLWIRVKAKHDDMEIQVIRN